MSASLDRRLGIGRTPPTLAAAALGGVWGLLGYALLWGHTPVMIHRTFVVSVPGTILLLPVRVVLWAIHVAEDLSSGPFDFSRNHGWIGVLAGVAGAGIAVAGYLVTRTVVRRARGG
ncbi:MAG: hypothetical protein ACRDJP_11095 [Actinomycetota bacterium]